MLNDIDCNVSLIKSIPTLPINRTLKETRQQKIYKLKCLGSITDTGESNYVILVSGISDYYIIKLLLLLLLLSLSLLLLLLVVVVVLWQCETWARHQGIACFSISN